MIVGYTITSDGNCNDNINCTPLSEEKEKNYIEELDQLNNIKNKLIVQINNLKSENSELKTKNQNQIIEIGTLQTKIQNLEDINEKLSEKLVILKDKNNSYNNDDLDELDNIN